MHYRVPDWYRDAKLGIMIHWGLPSVPAYAPTENGDFPSILKEHDWPFYFSNNPYAEWYENSLRIGGTPVAEYHTRSFSRFTPYQRFAARFNAGLSKWEPAEWVDLFQEAGARYVVMVAKHHDGFLLWPSDRSPRTPGYTAARDVVGELAQEVRSRGMRYGVYYSSLLDWTVQTTPIASFGDLLSPELPDGYAGYAEAHLRELITRYTPDVLWNDIGLPWQISRRAIFDLYRATVPEGVLNDRWGQTGDLARRILSVGPIRNLVATMARKAIAGGAGIRGVGDVATREYPRSISLQDRPWELVRGIGNSFCYNAAESESDYLSGPGLAHLLADVVSKNGNLLLNVGPRSDGTIPPEQSHALADLAAWLRTNGEAIYHTRPWVKAEGSTADGTGVRFTTKSDALYCILMGRPSGLTVALEGIDLRKLPESERARENRYDLVLSLLGFIYPVEWQIEAGRIVVHLPGSFQPGDAPVIKLSFEPPVSDRRGRQFYTDLV